MAPGPFQIILIILVIFLIFGASRFPSIMENLAKGVNSFKKGLKDEDLAKPKALESETKKEDE